MNAEEKAEARSLLSRVAALQAEFWDTLHEFENVTGSSIDSTADLTGYTDATDEQVAEVLECFDEEDHHVTDCEEEAE